MQQAGTDTVTTLRDHVRVALEDAGLMVGATARDGGHPVASAIRKSGAHAGAHAP
jgi:hypothetical protein